MIMIWSKYENYNRSSLSFRVSFVQRRKVLSSFIFQRQNTSLMNEQRSNFKPFEATVDGWKRTANREKLKKRMETKCCRIHNNFHPQLIVVSPPTTRKESSRLWEYFFPRFEFKVFKPTQSVGSSRSRRL